MSVINFGSSVSLKEFANAVSTVGRNVTIIGQGEPGIGKSAMLKEIARMNPGYESAYIDCTLLDLGDFALPYTVEENGKRVTRFAPNARFKMHVGKPVLIMLDEIAKAMNSVKQVLMTLMLEHRIGDEYLPDGSMVFGTTNLQSDGVGDMLQAHARNRVAFVTVRKPDKDEWVEWAMANDIDPVMIAWARYDHKRNPFASYTDLSERDNPYIFNPTRPGGGAFVTPRSLEKASHVVKQRAVLGDAVTISLLTGLIGEAAARDMPAFFSIYDKLPTREQIAKSPETAKLPDDVVARCMLVYGALTWVAKDTLDAVITYVKRMDLEWQALFATSLMKIEAKASFACHNASLKEWAVKNQWAL